MNRFSLALTALAVFLGGGTAPVQATQSALTEKEREHLWDKAHFAIKKMNICMEKAEREAARIKKIDVKKTTEDAIKGCVAGLATKNPYAVVVAGCLGALGSIAAESVAHWREARGYVRDAHYWAQVADECQERLWLDK